MMSTSLNTVVYPRVAAKAHPNYSNRTIISIPLSNVSVNYHCI